MCDKGQCISVCVCVCVYIYTQMSYGGCQRSVYQCVSRYRSIMINGPTCGECKSIKVDKGAPWRFGMTNRRFQLAQRERPVKQNTHIYRSGLLKTCRLRKELKSIVIKKSNRHTKMWNGFFTCQFRFLAALLTPLSAVAAPVNYLWSWASLWFSWRHCRL